MKNNSKFIKENAPIIIGKKAMIHAYKLNGWLYRIWEYPLIIETNSEFTVMASQGSRVLTSEENSTRSFQSGVIKPTFWFLFPDEWFNVICTEEKDGMRLYINLSSPFIYEEQAFKYFDFDLDFKILTSGKWREVDMKEFETNQIKYNYGSKLIDIIKEVEAKVIKLINEGYFEKLTSKSKIEEYKQKVLQINSARKEPHSGRN